MTEILSREGALVILAPILAGFWLIKFVQMLRRLPRDPQLSTDPPSPPVSPLLSIVIAVRDEERNIEDCIRSFQAQTYGNWEMIVVDDRSRDRTAEIVRRLATGDPRIRLLGNTEDPPPNWSAQVYANGKGVKESRGEWLVFTDADTRHHPAHLQAALAYCLKNRIAVFSILPGQICRGFWENTIQPFIFWLFWDYYPPRTVNRENCRRAGASGTFFLSRRDAYETIGGWASVHNAIPDDLAFMERAKALGLSAHLVIASRTLKVRMYHGLQESFDGWSRYMLSGADNNIAVALLEIFYALVFNFFPFCFPFLAGRYPWTSLFLALAAALIVIIRWRINRLLGSAAAAAFTHPAAALTLAAISLNAIWRRITGRGVRWRGRIYLEAGRSLFWTGKEYRVKEFVARKK